MVDGARLDVRRAPGWYVEIWRDGDEGGSRPAEVEETMGPYLTWTSADKVADGASINLNWDDHTIRVVYQPNLNWDEPGPRRRVDGPLTGLRCLFDYRGLKSYVRVADLDSDTGEYLVLFEHPMMLGGKPADEWLWVEPESLHQWPW